MGTRHLGNKLCSNPRKRITKPLLHKYLPKLNISKKLFELKNINGCDRWMDQTSKWVRRKNSCLCNYFDTKRLQFFFCWGGDRTYLRIWFISVTSMKIVIPSDQISQIARAIWSAELLYTVGSWAVLATIAEKVIVMRVIRLSRELNLEEKIDYPYWNQLLYFKCLKINIIWTCWKKNLIWL